MKAFKTFHGLRIFDYRYKVKFESVESAESFLHVLWKTVITSVFCFKNRGRMKENVKKGLYYTSILILSS